MIEATNRTATHERLLEVAARLFRSKGYAATTTREIAAMAGIRNASMYHHIERKDDLLYTLAVESLDRITRAVEAAIRKEAEPVAQLRAFIMAHVTTSLLDQDKHATMLTELRSLPPDRRATVVALRDRYEELLANVLREGQNKAVVRTDYPPEQLAIALLNLLNWTIFWFRPSGALSPHEIASMLGSIYLGGVTESGLQ